MYVCMYVKYADLNQVLFEKIKPSSLIYGSGLTPLCTSLKLKPNNIKETYFS